MLVEMAGLGFRHVELSHGIRITLVPGILRAVEEGVVKISSTHNFCPLPTGMMRPAPNLYEPSASDPRERDQWLRHTQRSIDFAAQVKAQVIVCHLGSVRFPWLNPARRIREYMRRHPDAGRTPEDRKFQALLQKSRIKLQQRIPPFWVHAKTGVNAIVDYARVKGVQLGIENRERFEELPLDSDFLECLESFGAGAPVGYWHDTGHADLKEGMGLLQHRMHLEKLTRQTLGFHLHDVSAQGHDHQPIGTGQVDFEMISRFWRPEHLLTLELSPRVSGDQVRESKKRIEALIG
jgi:sugar phosphate isomerase/epimerase